MIPTQPTAVDREATHLRLLVEAPDGRGTTEIALRRLVREQLGVDAAGREWRVSRLFQPLDESSDPELARFYEISGYVVSTPSYPLNKLAFDLARGLADLGPFKVDPDLPSSAFGLPDLNHAEIDGLAQTRRKVATAFDTDSKFWALDNINARAAWALPVPAGGAARGAGIRIGHPDTGYTLHPELELGGLDLLSDRDLIDNDDDALDPLIKRWWFPFDTPGHGTHTGSIIVGRGTGEISGVAPDATLVPIRTIRSVVQVLDGDLAKAVYYAQQVGCHVISISIGGVGFLGLQAAITHAVTNGVIVLAAVGNEVGFVAAPAVYPDCIGVAASTADDQPWSHSSHGSAVDICAPGHYVWVANVDATAKPPVFTVNNDHHGTSFSVAYLGGVAALWLAYHGYNKLIRLYGRSNLQSVFVQLLKTAGHRSPPDWDSSEYGAGIVDAKALLTAPLPHQPSMQVAPRTKPALLSPTERLTTIVPELTRDDIWERLARLFGVEDDSLQAIVDRFGRELVFLLSEDRRIRERFIEGRALEKVGTGHSRLTADIASSASLSLAQQLARG